MKVFQLFQLESHVPFMQKPNFISYIKNKKREKRGIGKVGTVGTVGTLRRAN